MQSALEWKLNLIFIEGFFFFFRLNVATYFLQSQGLFSVLCQIFLGVAPKVF